ncbi:hypothetical protein EJ03DRAFT_125800 [Teratosphaeria nubilosa]|uniref:Uncharacterized protein n=1 Tax=Teratosphaeria nubilosa TaxID=161662 RepID=A0A6G1LKA5_9PEZI|nr:hypothetical protein EJ03DRAFT_125800 [Teratosphaeria nubilosa]
MPWLLAILSTKEDQEKAVKWQREMIAGHVAFGKMSVTVAEEKLQKLGVKLPAFDSSAGPVMVKSIGISATPTPAASREKFGHNLRSWPNAGNGPHLLDVRPVDGRLESLPYTHTNYTWTSSDEISDLQRHISALAARQQQYAKNWSKSWEIFTRRSGWRSRITTG